MMFDETKIVKRVSKRVKERTKKNMEVYNMTLYYAFDEAVEKLCKKGSKLKAAWFYSDYREYIPSEYFDEYLDFEKYPLKYKIK